MTEIAIPATPDGHERNDPGPSIGEEAIRRAGARARKAGLLADAARHFGAIERPTRHDISMFRELFYQLIDGSTKSERRVIAASLARNAYTPRTILLYLALDDYDVAAPILLFSDSLTEQDIRGLAMRVGAQSLEILCRRASLTPVAVQALADAGGARCHELLAKNLAIRQYPETREILANKRNEIIAAAAMDLALHPVHGKEYEVSSTDVQDDPEQLLEAGTHAMPAAADARDDLVLLAARGGNLGRKPLELPADAIVARRPATARPFEPELVGLARRKDREGMAELVEARFGLPSRHALAILEHGGTSELIVLLKGIGTSDLGAMQCLMQLKPEVARNLAAYNQAKALLAKVDAETCRTFVESLGARPALVEEPARPRPVAAPVDRSALYEVASRRRQEILARAGIGPAPAQGMPGSATDFAKSA